MHRVFALYVCFGGVHKQDCENMPMLCALSVQLSRFSIILSHICICACRYCTSLDALCVEAVSVKKRPECNIVYLSLPGVCLFVCTIYLCDCLHVICRNSRCMCVFAKAFVCFYMHQTLHAPVCCE